MAIIEKPINVFTVANQLGYYEYAPHPITGQTVRYVDLGRLCTHPNINKWAQNKPVRLNTNGSGITEQQRKDVNYGLEFPNFSNVDDLIAYYKITNEWKYIRPTNATGYRIGDFRNYDHNARRFYRVLDIPASVENNKTELTVRMTSSNIENLKWGDFDFSNLSELHFGAVIMGSQAWEMTQGTNPLPIEVSGNNFADVPFNAIPKSGEYSVYAYVARMFGTNPMNYYPLDGGSLGSFYFTAPQPKLIVNLRGRLNIAMGLVEWTLDITNLGYGSTLNNVAVKLRYGDNEPNDQLELGEGQQLLGNINISNGYSTSGTFFGFDEYLARGGYMYFSHSTTGQENHSGKHSLIIQ